MNNILDALHAMKTTHGNFNEQEVAMEQLEVIMQAAVRAANASNRQSYSIIAITDQEKIKQHFHYPANKALLFCVDYNRTIDSANHLNKPFEVNGIMSFVHGCVDASLAAENAAIAAHALGINRMFTNALHRGNLAELDQSFNLPEKYCFPLIVLLLGYEDQQEDSHTAGRIYGPGIIHYDQYQPANKEQLEQIMETYNNPENHLTLFTQWKEKGYDNYLDWYFENWPNKANSAKQQEMVDYLTSKGFLPSNE